jgi:hypothetical protein
VGIGSCISVTKISQKLMFMTSYGRWYRSGKFLQGPLWRESLLTARVDLRNCVDAIKRQLDEAEEEGFGMDGGR